MTSIIHGLRQKGIGLLITVDELDPKTGEMAALTSVFQHFVRERLDVALLMAGLPSKVSDLLRDDSISFLRRAFRHKLDPVGKEEVGFALRKTIEEAGRSIEGLALDAAVAGTKGFPFMIQLVGYHTWRQNPDIRMVGGDDVEKGLALAQSDLERMIYDVTYRDLSDRDISFLTAMLDDGGHSLIADVAARMGVTPGYAGVYRRRLIEQGIISGAGHGKVAFEMPMWREYLSRRIHG